VLHGHFLLSSPTIFFAMTDAFITSVHSSISRAAYDTLSAADKQTLDDLNADRAGLEERIQDEGLSWAVAFLKFGMDLHVRREGNAPKARQLLVQSARTVYGDDANGAVLRALEQQATQDAAADETDWSEWTDLLDATEPGPDSMLVALLLVFSSIVDRHWSDAQKVYLHAVVPSLLPLDAAELRGWLVGSWSADRYRMLDGEVDAIADGSSSLRARLAGKVLAFSKQNRDLDITPEEFNALRDAVGNHLHTMRDAAQALGASYVRRVQQTLDVIDDLKRIRVVVLGEFNVGKSTLVNRVLCRPDFMPTDGLPSTSGIIEITSGERETFARKNARQDDAYEPVSPRQFYEKAGDANRQSVEEAQAHEANGQAVQYWRVTISGDLITAEEQVTLVDTPGLNEDPMRDKLSRLEARSAHAAILVMDASQPLTQYERQLVNTLSGQIRGLLVVLNKADRVSEDAARRSKQRVLDHLGPLGLREEQVVLFSANQTLGNGTPSAGISADTLNATIQKTASTNVTPVRYGRLMDAVERCSQMLSQQLGHQETRLRQSLEELEGEKKQREKERKRCENLIGNLKKFIEKEGRKTSQAVAENFRESWPGIIEKLEDSRSEWDTDINPITSPKKATEDIASDAEESLIKIVERWANSEASEILKTNFEEILEGIHKRLKDVAKYIGGIQGIDGDSIIVEIIQRSVKEAFNVDDLSVKGFKIRYLIISIVAALVPQIITSIVFGTIASIIAFLINPFVLASIAISAIGLSIFIGVARTLERIKSEVAKVVSSKLGNKKVMKKIEKKIKSAFTNKFDALALAVAEEASSYVEEAEHQFENMIAQLKAEEDQKEKTQRRIDTLRKEIGQLVAISARDED
jgi:GTP-binding protein EngB required for normal cell division